MKIISIFCSITLLGFSIFVCQQVRAGVVVKLADTIDIGCHFGDVSADESLVACGTINTALKQSVFLLDAPTLKIISSTSFDATYEGGFSRMIITPNKRGILLGREFGASQPDMYWIPSKGTVKGLGLNKKITQVKAINPNLSTIYSVSHSLNAAENDTIEIWDKEGARSGVMASFISPPKGDKDRWGKEIFYELGKLDITKDGRFLVASARAIYGIAGTAKSVPNKVYVWDAKSEKLVHIIDNASTFSLSEDGKAIVTSHFYRDVERDELPARTVKTWDLTTGRLTHEVRLPIDHKGIVRLAISSDKRFVAYGNSLLESSTSGTQGMGLVDLQSGKEVLYQETSASFLAFINKGRTLLVGDNKLSVFTIQDTSRK